MVTFLGFAYWGRAQSQRTSWKEVKRKIDRGGQIRQILI